MIGIDGRWIKFLHCRGQGFGSLRVKEDPGAAIEDGFQGAAGAKRDHGTAGCLGLDRRDSKVFDARKNERRCGLVVTL